MKVLIVDDHAVVREGIKSALERKNLQCIAEAHTKAEAIAQIARTNPDAIVVDLNLPDGNGLEIVSWVRKISATIGIVVLTMHDSDQYLLASMQAGASAHILKSAPLSQLVAAVEHSIVAPLSFISNAITVNTGLKPPLVLCNEASATNRLSNPQTRPCESVTDFRGSLPIRHVPAWC